MKSFDTKDLKVSNRKFQNLTAHLMQFVKFPMESLKVPIGKILMIPNFVIQTLKVPI